MENRYSRQILLDDIGELGQRKLNKAKVLVIGAGGLGCPVLTYLICAGVGNIRIVDCDIISESNLNRQFLYGPGDIGKEKVFTAKHYLNKQNPEVIIEAFNDRVNEDNIQRLIDGIDIVVDCVDNITTRLITNSACLEKNIPLVDGGVEGFYGFATVVKRDSACLECMGFYEGNPKEPAAVVGVTAGIIGSFEANECIRILLGYKSDLEGKFLQYDGKKQTIQKVHVKIDPNCSAHKRYNKLNSK
ncbi:HesA/MoeB/ThiF family protein [Clostridium grantii]|uniref:Adenylyltransferase and sulfurtransferase n=1 Tax=Clostridium grantii DSM 8605 TaxID=1121316 RepID=A0A1M5TPI2_9CLOT|nr:HesA/MoeB/ThiF family protein [Clostridium grantii]SHH52303.1 adenylyltransferase and sulfurtransferase [Clostridium grantii DSM 8605]